AGAVGHFSGGAGSGPGARTLWQTTSGGRLSVTVALFAEYPAAGKRPARPAHLPDTAPYLAAGLTESVSSKTLEVPPAGLP
ncbi:penicillin-binding protein, partial [Streptomyces sp. NPDC052015]